jgi:hypothetical protein
VPAAEQAAEEFHDRLVNGLLGLVVSFVCLGVGGARAIDHSIAEDDFDQYDAALLGCFVVGYAVGLHQLATAQPYMYDAINIYNDSVDGFVPQPPAGGTWVPPAR